jgi:sugar/nucleoside kinase (ribokinase family)
MSKLLVVGSVALDTIATQREKKEEILGGAATYISIAAGYFTPCNLVAVVGDDFPQEYASLLSSRNVDLAGLERAQGRTFRWSGVYADDFSTRETLSTELGVFESFDPKVPEAYLESGFALLGNIHPGLQLGVLNALPSDTFVAADTMNLWIDTTSEELAEVIRKVDLLLINDEEAFMLTGERQIVRAADKIREDGPSALIIKRGEHGAYLFTDSAPFFAPALPLPDVADPTGAGDTFAGGLLGYLAQVDDRSPQAIKKGMIYGAAVASRAVEAFGADQFARLQKSEIDERYEALRSLTSLE